MLQIPAMQAIRSAKVEKVLRYRRGLRWCSVAFALVWNACMAAPNSALSEPSDAEKGALSVAFEACSADQETLLKRAIEMAEEVIRPSEDGSRTDFERCMDRADYRPCLGSLNQPWEQRRALADYMALDSLTGGITTEEIASIKEAAIAALRFDVHLQLKCASLDNALAITTLGEYEDNDEASATFDSTFVNVPRDAAHLELFESRAASAAGTYMHERSHEDGFRHGETSADICADRVGAMSDLAQDCGYSYYDALAGSYSTGANGLPHIIGSCVREAATARFLKPQFGERATAQGQHRACP